MVERMVTTVIAFFCLFAGANSQQARVLFNQGGVTGWMTFTQQMDGSVFIYTAIRSEQPVDGWHVHNLPVDFTSDPAGRCIGAAGHYDPSNRFGLSSNYSAECTERTPLGCEAGDLSGKYGCLVTSGNASYASNDEELQLQGRYGIIGRSVVIHNPDGSRLACGNIVIDDDLQNIYAATFVSPIAGTIYFRQSTTTPSIGTFVYTPGLYYVDGQPSPTRNHEWHIHVNNPGFRYVMGDCSEAGPHYNPEGIDINADDYRLNCNPDNISNCVVGDLSNKLGLLEIAIDPSGVTQHTWTDANLHMYDVTYRTLAIHTEERGEPIIACAPIVLLAPLQASAYRPPDDSLFTLSQRSPYDPTMVTSTVDLSANSYQINRDGNIRTTGNNMCYSDMVYSPFDVLEGVSTEDSYDLGNITGKYIASMAAGQMFNSEYLPLFNRYSILGRNLMVDESGSVTCGTLNPSGSSVSVVQAWVDFSSPMMNGRITFRQILNVQQDGSYVTGPTLVNYRFNYAMDGLAQTDGHNWHVHRERTGVDGPTRTCDIVQGHYNPYRVNLATNYPDLCNSSDTNLYPLRCEVGDLSGKHGQLSIRATGAPERTLVFYDPNLPLVGPYTILGRSVAVHTPEGPIMACSNIEPAVISDIELQIAFPNLPGGAMDPKVALPVAIVDLLNNTNVTYGEVLVYNVSVGVVSSEGSDCTVVTLRFTEFTNGSPDDTVRLVRSLDQINLPAQYRPGACPRLDLNGTNIDVRSPDGASVMKPFSILTGVFAVIVLAFVNFV